MSYPLSDLSLAPPPCGVSQHFILVKISEELAILTNSDNHRRIGKVRFDKYTRSDMVNLFSLKVIYGLIVEEVLDTVNRVNKTVVKLIFIIIVVSFTRV